MFVSFQKRWTAQVLQVTLQLYQALKGTLQESTCCLLVILAQG